MNFRLKPEHLMCRETFRKFAETEVAPLAIELDENERFPVELLPKLRAAGMMGSYIDRSYEGQGTDVLTYAILAEELSRACAAVGTIVGAHTSLCAAPIADFGTEQQKQKYLIPLAKGEMLGAFALTEAGAGSDASGQKTVARIDGDRYVLNGTKIFITNAGYADVYIIMAMTDPSQGTRGISAFIVEKNFPGFSIGTQENKMGIRASSTCELIMQDCIVPKENLLGAEGKGFGIAMKTLDGGRIGIAAQATGIAQGALDKTVAYVKERKQFGRSISAFQNTQFVLAEMATRVEAARLMTYRAAVYKDNKMPYGTEAAMAKLFTAEAAMDVTTKAVQLHGGYGYIREYEVERMMRDAKITEIYEGTSEVQKMVISSALLK